MDKKLTPLEAWKEIKRQIGSATYIRNDTGAPQITTMRVKDTGLFEIIDRAFIQLEYYKTLCEAYVYFIHDPEHKYPVLELGAMIKAIEIIKKFDLEIIITKKNAFVTSKTIKGIFNAYLYITDKKEEIKQLELLKKVLCLKNC